MPKPDGGYAFPLHVAEVHGIATKSDEFGPGCGGMSVRQFFAAAALPAVMAARVALANADLGTDLNQESIAEECFELADALLAASAKEDEEV